MKKQSTTWRRVREAAPKSCPFCGGRPLIERSPVAGLFAVRRSQCRAHSPFRVFAFEAVAAWNWRVGEGGAPVPGAK